MQDPTNPVSFGRYLSKGDATSTVVGIVILVIALVAVAIYKGSQPVSNPNQEPPAATTSPR